MTSEHPPDWRRWREQVDLTAYDERWRQLAAAGENPHGEADLVARYQPQSVLDAGCGTGRVAIELARRGIDVVGADLDADMIARARDKAPELTWVRSDLADLALARQFDVVVLAGNVIPYVAAANRQAAVLCCAGHLAPGGRLIAGFQLRADWPTLAEYDAWCSGAGLRLDERFAAWDGEPFTAGGPYAVSVHRRS